MLHHMIRAARSGLVLAALAQPALAQTGIGQGYAGERPTSRYHGPTNPNEGMQPNGCFKLCPLDTNPCDPPEFKKADGRCSLKD